ncbi:MAG: hypothetical protein ABR564_09350 [Candidatus Dormibacteria bacterium]
MRADMDVIHTPLAVTGDFGLDHWAYVVAPLIAYVAVVLGLAAAGSMPPESSGLVKLFFQLISSTLRRITGFPGWAASTVMNGLFVLGLAVFGLYWDVAWHIDLGRDRELFTPPHTMIVLGLGGLVYSAVVAVIFASVDGAPVGLRLRAVRIPYSALALGALGLGGLVAFPLDNLWHQAYGLDVTLWSPTHLQLVAGGGFATVALWLFIAESARDSRPNWFGHILHVVVAGATLVAVTTFEGEFDFGVPQFQALYLPLLISAAAGFALVVARIALGPGGALKALVAYLALRISIALFVAGVLNHTVPRFPLYAAAALGVEVVAWRLGTRRRVRFGVISGLVVGTVGIGAESAWIILSGWLPSSPGLLLKTALLAPVAAVATALIGASLGRAFSAGFEVPRRLLAVAGLALVAVCAYPLPRNAGSVSAVTRLQQHGELASVDIQLDPPDAARDADALAIVAWQGGGRLSASLDEVGPGHYVSSRELPVTGGWKTVVSLQRGDEVMAAAIHLPPDPQIGAAAVPAVPQRHIVFQQNTRVLLREVHDGPAWPAILAYGGLGLLVAGWFALLAAATVRARVESDAQPSTPAGERRLVPSAS